MPEEISKLSIVLSKANAIRTIVSMIIEPILLGDKTKGRKVIGDKIFLATDPFGSIT